MRRQHETGCAWRRTLALTAMAAVAALGLAACGGDDDNGTTAAATQPANTATTGGGGGGGGSTIDISTPSGSDLAFEQSDVTAKAGSDTISFDNRQALGHDVKVEDSSGNEIGGTDIISSSTATATVNLQPGTYTFFCSVPGHREAGMEGTLTVK
jgi:plastocyanin